jgi:hypothetical protein
VLTTGSQTAHVDAVGVTDASVIPLRRPSAWVRRNQHGMGVSCLSLLRVLRATMERKDIAGEYDALFVGRDRLARRLVSTGVAAANDPASARRRNPITRLSLTSSVSFRHNTEHTS